jgi:signal transduction histidine kinase
LQKFSRKINSLVTEQELVTALGRTLRESERLRSFGIYIIDANTQNLVLKDGDEVRWKRGTIIEQPLLLQETMIHRHGAVYRNEIARELRSGLPHILRRNRTVIFRSLQRFNAQMSFPFIMGEQFFGFLAFGFDDPETELSVSEEAMLSAVIRQLTAAIAHSRVVERESTREQLATIGQLASGLAHEIRNPLATINATVQYLQTMKVDESSQEFFTIIRDEVGRLNRFVERFLTYAKPRQTDLEIHVEELGDLIQRIILLYKNQNKSSSLKFTTHFQNAAHHLNVPGDAWSQILNNLIENAIHAMGDGGEITISASVHAEANELEVVVEDNGPGIPQEDWNLVFRPFYTTREKGTGLGLAIVHQVVQNIHGSITLERSSTGGARFTIHQPAPPALEAMRKTEPEMKAHE